jgi:hypothetical protein
MIDHESDEQLFNRLRRIVMAAKTARPDEDRRRLLALENDVRSLRAVLNERCSLLVEKINAAGEQLSAISAYSRCASLRREPSRAGRNNKAME